MMFGARSWTSIPHTDWLSVCLLVSSQNSMTKRERSTQRFREEPPLIQAWIIHIHFLFPLTITWTHSCVCVSDDTQIHDPDIWTCSWFYSWWFCRHHGDVSFECSLTHLRSVRWSSSRRARLDSVWILFQDSDGSCLVSAAAPPAFALLIGSSEPRLFAVSVCWTLGESKHLFVWTSILVWGSRWCSVSLCDAHLQWCPGPQINQSNDFYFILYMFLFYFIFWACLCIRFLLS